MPRLTKLTSLALDKCEVTGGLPTAISMLTGLRVLSLDGCVAAQGADGVDSQHAWAGEASGAQCVWGLLCAVVVC